MSRVDEMAETTKLSRLLEVDEERLAYLAPLGAEGLRDLRERVSATLYDDTRPMLERVASSSKLLPNGLVATLGERVFGAMLCARIAGLLAPERGAAVAMKMPEPFLADVSKELDPRSAREVLALLPTERIVAVAALLLERGDHLTMGRFVDCLSLETLKAVIDDTEDDGALLRIAFFIETKSKISDLVGLLSPERVRAVVAYAGSGGGDLWVEALAIMSHMDDRWKSRIGDVVAAEGESFMLRLLEAAREHDLWDSMLPLVERMSPDSQRRLFAVVSARAELLEAFRREAERMGLWQRLQASLGL